MPFATAWMGENHFQQNTVVIYAVLANLCGIAYYILLTVIKKCNPGNNELLSVLEKQLKKGIISKIIYTIAIPVAFFKTAISGALIGLVAIMWLIPDKNIEKVVSEN